jgi:hypothetical protein
VRAEAFMEKVLAVDPSFEGALDHLAIELVATGDAEKLQAYARRWESAQPSPGVLHALTRVRVGLGDTAAALATARHHTAMHADAQGPRDAVGVLFTMGDYAAAELAARDALKGGARDELLNLRLVFALHAQGRTRDALRELDASLPQRDGAANYALRRAVLLASSGRRQDAAAAAREIDGESPYAGEVALVLALNGGMEEARPFARAMRPRSTEREIWDALEAWHRGDLAGASSRLRALDRLDPMPDYAPAPSFVLAEIASAAGEDADVLPAVRRYRTFLASGLVQAWTSPRATFLLARAQARLGHVDDARRELERLLAQWSSADADQPLLAEARALRAKLASGGAH